MDLFCAGDTCQVIPGLVQRGGEVYVSSTRIDGALVLRAAILASRTHLEHVERLLDVLGRTAQELEGEA